MEIPTNPDINRHKNEITISKKKKKFHCHCPFSYKGSQLKFNAKERRYNGKKSHFKKERWWGEKEQERKIAIENVETQKMLPRELSLLSTLCCNDGQPGSNGIPGVNGLPGSTGAPGRDGRDGIKGEQGSPGKTGPQGPTGAKGMKGECCITGPVGPKGDRRKKGDSGIQAGPHNMCSA